MSRTGRQRMKMDCEIRSRAAWSLNGAQTSSKQCRAYSIKASPSNGPLRKGWSLFSPMYESSVWKARVNLLETVSIQTSCEFFRVVDLTGTDEMILLRLSCNNRIQFFMGWFARSGTLYMKMMSMYLYVFQSLVLVITTQIWCFQRKHLMNRWLFVNGLAIFHLKEMNFLNVSIF